jgi:hypothetical protein
MRKELIRGLLICIFCLGAWSLHAQPGDPGGDPDVPIGGIGMLLAAGGLWGAKKIYDIRRKNKE